MAHLRNRRAAAASLLLALASLSCNRQVKVEQNDAEGPQITSLVHTGDPKSETQLVNGFYGIEQGAWRWTAQQFSVLLRPPAGAAQKGATLKMQLSVSDATITALKTITLSGTAGGATLSPETYTQAGPFTYSRDVPPGQLAGDSIRIDFQLDKALPPRGTDLRGLGLIVSSIALEAK